MRRGAGTGPGSTDRGRGTISPHSSDSNAQRQTVEASARYAAADDLPDERQVWIEGWNAMMTGAEMPGPVARAVKTHGHAPVRALLAKLLGV